MNYRRPSPMMSVKVKVKGKLTRFYLNHCSRTPGPGRSAQEIQQSLKITEEESREEPAETHDPQQQEGEEGTEGISDWNRWKKSTGRLGWPDEVLETFL